MGRPYSDNNVFVSFNLRVNLLHNFFLKCRAYASKMREYKMGTDPCARIMVGYLLVRGGLHMYALALKKTNRCGRKENHARTGSEQRDLPRDPRVHKARFTPRDIHIPAHCLLHVPAHCLRGS